MLMDQSDDDLAAIINFGSFKALVQYSYSFRIHSCLRLLHKKLDKPIFTGSL